ncbi:hypothetical protein VNI00_017523 [Paramarasmius palmivorus]|uniref:Uncharacterized protein n=1 Tax=Paramarasmius palmivorus TaxID=297713 RepID=A0AAW0B803_9AGAR
MDAEKSRPERTVVKTDDGYLRFKLNLRNNTIEPPWHDLGYELVPSIEPTWLSQSPKIFNEHNVTGIETERYCGRIELWSRSGNRYESYISLPGEDPSTYKTMEEYTLMIPPMKDDQAPEEARPKPSQVYLFIESPPIKVVESKAWLRNPGFWSLDEIGESKVSEDECYRWDLPVVSASYDPQYKSWSKGDYTALEEWQVARGFDPKTSDWARSMGYPEMEVIGTKRPDRFEEVVDDTLNMPGSWKD